jgi:hypothetical protein
MLEVSESCSRTWGSNRLLDDHADIRTAVSSRNRDKVWIQPARIACLADNAVTITIRASDEAVGTRREIRNRKRIAVTTLCLYLAYCI